MNRMIYSAAFASLLAVMMTGSGAHAFGNACKRVNFTVGNNVGYPITVDKFELYSASEGRYLNENFPDVVVPLGAQNFVVRRGETVEYGENDSITNIRVSYSFTDSNGNAFRTTSTDYNAGGICVADRWYNAEVQ